MEMQLSDMTAPVRCPKCGYEVQEKISRLQQNPTVTCQACGSLIDIDGNKLREIDSGPESPQKIMDDIRKLLR